MSTPVKKFKFETTQRDSLYYKQFRYVGRFFLRESGALRYSSHSEIDRHLDMRASWRWRSTELSSEVRTNIYTVFDQLQTLSDDNKITIFANWIYLYTNDLADIDRLAVGPAQQRGSVTQAVISRPMGTVGQLNPQFKFRTYLKAYRPTTEQINALEQFVTNCGSELKISPGLRNWFASKNRLWLQDHFFIDHNDMKMATMIALINPKLIRKTKPIVKINN